MNITHPQLCDTYEEVKSALEKDHLLSKTKCRLGKRKRYLALVRLWVLALKGESQRTFEELAPHFLADIYGRDENKNFVLPSSRCYWEFATMEVEDGISREKMHEENPELFDEAYGYLDREWDKSAQFNVSRCRDPKPNPKDETCGTRTFEDGCDIVITDPCYIRKFLPSVEFSRGTLYGDWSCTVFKCDRNRKVCRNKDGQTVVLGQFCADGGQVCVERIGGFASKSVEKEFWTWIEQHPHCATVIRRFKGMVEYHELTDYTARDGTWHPNTSLILVGHGTSEGRTLHFVGSQTGF